MIFKFYAPKSCKYYMGENMDSSNSKLSYSSRGVFCKSTNAAQMFTANFHKNSCIHIAIIYLSFFEIHTNTIIFQRKKIMTFFYEENVSLHLGNNVSD